MPYNKAERIHNQQNHASIKEASTTLKLRKAAHRAPSLNRISK
ncbi:hypothetical protein [Paenibacillus sp. 481]|nr:hypothetical protein [Paenibacillus sp. 481]